MKIWLTSFVYEDEEYPGPRIFAETELKAKFLCEMQGLTLAGQLKLMDEYEFSLDTLERDENTVLH